MLLLFQKELKGYFNKYFVVYRHKFQKIVFKKIFVFFVSEKNKSEFEKKDQEKN